MTVASSFDMLIGMARHVCPWWLGYLLASPLRRLFQDPGKILEPFVSDGMTVIELGPGMGFFTLELARKVGPRGRVIAIDVQPKMLAGLVRRASKAGLSGRIQTRLPNGDRLGVEDLKDVVDFALAFAVVHEVAKPDLVLANLHDTLKPGAKLLLVEPVGHVSTKDFEGTLAVAQSAGFQPGPRVAIRRSHAAVLVRS